MRAGRRWRMRAGRRRWRMIGRCHGHGTREQMCAKFHGCSWASGLLGYILHLCLLGITGKAGTKGSFASTPMPDYQLLRATRLTLFRMRLRECNVCTIGNGCRSKAPPPLTPGAQSVPGIFSTPTEWDGHSQFHQSVRTGRSVASARTIIPTVH